MTKPIEQTISSCLQSGTNPYRSAMSSYSSLSVTHLGNQRYELQPLDMRGSDIHYKYLKQTVGAQTLVSTIKVLAAKYRIHKENYTYNDLQQTDNDTN